MDADRRALFDAALHYRDALGWSIIPIGADKKPTIAWKQYQTRRATDEDMAAWFAAPGVTGIAVATGKLSAIEVLDLDAKHNVSAKVLAEKGYHIPATVSARSGGGGEHHFFAYSGKIKKNIGGNSFLGPGVDVKTDGGYIILAPSLHPSGNKYEWIVRPEDGLADVPDWLIELSQTSSRSNWRTIANTNVEEGARHGAAVSVAAGLISTTPTIHWESLAWPRLQAWNEARAFPPLPINELRQVFDSYCKKDAEKSPGDTKGGGEDPRASQATQIAELVMNNKALTLFLDQYKVAHVRMPVGDHFEIWPCGSSDFRYWLSNEYFTLEGKAAGTNVLSAALNTIEGKARALGLHHRLHNRIAESDGAYWYDLGDEKHRAVRLDAKGWSVVNNPPILFRRLPYHQSQVEPVGGGNVKELLRFVNVKDADEQLLLLVYLVAAFIPGFPHPLLYVHGAQGSAKTSLIETLHALVDPSALGSLSLPRNIEDLKQTLHHHSAFACFDNVSGIDWETADLLCRAVTGAGFSKRKLYTDDETVIYHVQANIVINGVNLGSSRPDLLERSILMELTRIEEGERKQHAELGKAFADARPRILGAIFDTVAKALVLLPGIKLTGMFRMADFTVYGAAIAEAAGYSQDDFLSAYRRNVTAQNQEVLEGNVVGSLILALMETTQRWESTPSKLLSELKRLADERFIDERQLPKNANALMRQMRDIKPALEASKIEWFRDVGHERTVVIRKLPGAEGAPGIAF